MRTQRGLFERLTDPDHLERCAALTVRGKRRRPEVAAFLFRAEAELRRIERALREGRWRHGPFELLLVRDPKPRVIAKAEVADRVVHTALVKLLEPVFLPSLTDDAFACRPGKGTHRALLRLLELVRRHRFVVHLDLRSYFPSLDPARVLALVARRVRDERFLAVVAEVLRAGSGLCDREVLRRHARMDPAWPPRGRGLPIGAFTSQLFAAHVVLADLDHAIKRAWKVPGYVRYVDDLFLFGDQRGELWHWRELVGEWVVRERDLRLKVERPRVLSCGGHLDALGHRVRRSGIEPLPGAVRRLRASLARRARGDPAELWRDLASSVESRVGGLLFG